MTEAIETAVPSVAAGRLECALKLAAMGLRILPCKPGSKVPVFEGYQEDATTDPSIIRQQITGDRNYGVLADSGWVVVDLDVKHGKDGIKAFTAACEQTGIDLAKMKTFTVRTPTDGRHIYFRSKEEIRYGTDVLGTGSGVDIRSQGKGYVIGPGSVIGENAYQILEDAPITDLGALAAIFPKGSPEPRSVNQAPLPGVDPGRADTRARAYLTATPGARVGSRGSTAYRVACRLKNLGCSEKEALLLMDLHWNDKCEPPMPDEDLAESVNHAFCYSREAQGSAAPEAVFELEPEPEGDPLDHARMWSAARIHQNLEYLADRYPRESKKVAALLVSWIQDQRIEDADRTRLEQVRDLHDQGSHLNTIDRSDVGCANLLYRLTRGNLRFVVEAAAWIWWDGAQWHRDPNRIHATEAARLVGQHYAKSLAEMEKDLKAKVKAGNLDVSEEKTIEKAHTSRRKWIEHCWSKRGLDAMLDVLSRDSRVTIEAGALDKDPWLLGVQNGVVDLRTGQLRPAARDEFVTRRAAVPFDPSAVAPRWLQFIEEVTGRPKAPEIDPASGDPVPGTVGHYEARPEFAHYIKKALGYVTTGSTDEQKMLIAIGDGSNGKNVMLDTIKEVLHDYARAITPEALMATRHDADAERPSPTAASLAGVRLAVSSESRDGARLDVALIKAHTGNRFMTARRMRENTFEFIVTHKLVLMTNHRPSLDHVDDALRGRLHLIPFDRRWNRPGHPERNPLNPDGDPTLAESLRAEAQGILAWLVEGAVAYRQGRLEPPKEVIAMTTDYFAQQDPLSRWLMRYDRCDAKAGTSASELFKEFSTWLRDEDDGAGAAPTSPKAFGRALKDRHQVQKHDRNTGAFYGLIMKRPRGDS